MTPLHWAVKKDYYDVTIILLRAGSFTDTTDIVYYYYFFLDYYQILKYFW